jgi:lipopolysaccharide/colanic/teichoic acid biosynthesis glycosyltransferase
MSRPGRIVDFALVAVGFAIAIGIYQAFLGGGLTVPEMAVGSGASAVAFYLAIQLRPGSASASESEWVLVVEQFCLGTGVNLLLHAILTWAYDVRRAPFLVAGGGFFAAVLLAAAREWVYRKRGRGQRVLLIGFDSIGRILAGRLGGTVVGIVGVPEVSVPEEIPILGELDELREIVARVRPDRLIVDMQDWEARIPASYLMDCRRAGVRVEESPLVYESLFSRVCCQRLEPVDLLISAALRGDARTMAIQAVYTNLIGLTSLIILSPVMLLATLAIVCFGGRGPVFERVECAGFQYIPFRLLRFRTTSTAGDERKTWAGHVISRFGLVNLPQLINIVRGDMALVGPRPARRQFAWHLTEVMPFYGHRFSVKPGIIGWAQVHAPKGPSRDLPEECRDIEYDLFYIKEGSLWMDIEILVDAMFGSPQRRSPSAT